MKTPRAIPQTITVTVTFNVDKAEYIEAYNNSVIGSNNFSTECMQSIYESVFIDRDKLPVYIDDATIGIPSIVENSKATLDTITNKLEV